MPIKEKVFKLRKGEKISLMFDGCMKIKPRKYNTVINRNIYYLNEVFTSGLEDGESYNNIENTFLINFNTFYTNNIHKKIFDYYYLMKKGIF